MEGVSLVLLEELVLPKHDLLVLAFVLDLFSNVY